MESAFVILHYLAYEMTVECVDNLLSRFRGQGVKVVVVDNGSPNGSGAMLRKRYAQEPDVDVLLLESNMGFARGNNAGYSYAVRTFDPEFVIVMNNDVLIDQDDFLDKVRSSYARNPFAVLGPDIYSPDADIHQSPAALTPMSLQQARALRDKIGKRFRHFCYRYCSWKIKLALGLAHEPGPIDRGLWKEYHDDAVLHGACYIFSKDFTQRREAAFCPDTFLFHEEDILSYECRKEGLPMRYDPDLQVRHLEDVSTSQMYRGAYARARMKARYELESMDILLRIMEEDLEGER